MTVVVYTYTGKCTSQRVDSGLLFIGIYKYDVSGVLTNDHKSTTSHAQQPQYVVEWT